jgi:hypothetical protein
MPIPKDTDSLLVPIHLDAFVYNSNVRNASTLSWYEANYSELSQFNSPLPAPFTTSPPPDENGVYLHWSLPDALTQGRESGSVEDTSFPLVPNRWLIVRYHIADSGQGAYKLWVVESDFLDVGGTAGSSSFVDPFNPTKVSPAKLGRMHTIQAWESGDFFTAKPFLRAVGPGNVTFAAYLPFVRNVFSFFDAEVEKDSEGNSSGLYTYWVTGWFDQPEKNDPLSAVHTFPKAGHWNIWPSEADWQAQSPNQRFTTLLKRLKWSIEGDPGAQPPSTTLYHALVSGVDWNFRPQSTPDDGPLNTRNTRIVIGNNSIDALATLIHAEAGAQANKDPEQKKAWEQAGQSLDDLLRAAQYDLLEILEQPGAGARLSHKTRDHWFGSMPGGRRWDIVGAVSQTAEGTPQTPQANPAQWNAINRQLGALNEHQRKFDRDKRILESMQTDLYHLWVKNGKSASSGDSELDKMFGDGGGDSGPELKPVNETAPMNEVQDHIKKQLSKDNPDSLFNKVWDKALALQEKVGKLPPQLTLEAEAAQKQIDQWADQHFVDIPGKDKGKVTLSSLGLQLKETVAERFWHPNDPVILIEGLNRAQRHGEDGRYQEDDTLHCRLPGQTVTGEILLLDHELTNEMLSTGGFIANLNVYKKIPDISLLLEEGFWVSPSHAAAISGLGGGAAASVNQRITEALNEMEQHEKNTFFQGALPAPFSIRPWRQAWAPLYLEWEVQWYPSGKVVGSAHTFSMDDWTFDGAEYSWNGNTGFDPKSYNSYQGRTFLTPHAPLLFREKVEKYLKKHPGFESKKLDELKNTVDNWDILSQSISGLAERLITLEMEESLPPPHSGDESRAISAKGSGQTPSLAALIGDQYQSYPITDDDGNHSFYPIRGGFLQFTKLRVMDAFGQFVDLIDTNRLPTQDVHENQLLPMFAHGLKPADPLGKLSPGVFQLPPSILQASRLEFRFLDNDGTGKYIDTSGNPNAVCGWLLPNHLDNTISIYDRRGGLLGEIDTLAPNGWRPSPEPAGKTPEASTPEDITNESLKQVVKAVASLFTGAFQDFSQLIDETLWTIDPLGERKDQMLTVLLGRPLAVVDATVQLQLYGNPLFDQRYNKMLAPQQSFPAGQQAQSPWKEVYDSGSLLTTPFPVRLGSQDLRNDGLVGYFQGNDFSKFHAVHMPKEISRPHPFIEQIGSDGKNYIYLKPEGPAVKLTLLLDPRGGIHLNSGIMPTTLRALSGHLVEDFLKQIKVTFHAGPIIGEPGPLHIPQPDEKDGTWTWLDAASQLESALENTKGQVRFPDEKLQLREGWLKFSK